MADDETVGDATMLVQNDEISDAVVSTRFNKFFNDVISAIDALTVGKNESHFFCKLLQARRGIARRCNYNFRVGKSGIRIFVVGRRFGLYGAVFVV